MHAIDFANREEPAAGRKQWDVGQASRGRRVPDPHRANWVDLGPEDRSVYFRWLIGVACFYACVVLILALVLGCSTDRRVTTVHMPKVSLHPDDVVGFAASIAVLITFLMPTMALLRLVAIVSNVLFVAYGYLGHIYPVLLLHVALLPINVTRLLFRRDF